MFVIISRGWKLWKESLNWQRPDFFLKSLLHNLTIEWYNINVSDLCVHTETRFEPQFDEGQLMLLFFRHFYENPFSPCKMSHLCENCEVFEPSLHDFTAFKSIQFKAEDSDLHLHTRISCDSEA